MPSYSITPLLAGVRNPDQGIMTYQNGYGKRNLKPEDIDIVINTHLHDDHCGNNGLFTKATFYTHQPEIDFCHSPHPLDHHYDPTFIEGIDFVTVEDGSVIVPGIEVLHSPGHSVGVLSIKVATEAGPAVITGFCCDRENFPANGPAVCPGVHLDAMAAWDSIQKVKGLGAIIPPMHELSLQRIAA